MFKTKRAKNNRRVMSNIKKINYYKDLSQNYLKTHKITKGIRAGKTHEERFNESYIILKNSCWEWTKRLNICGYGILVINDKNYPSHRVSYMLYNGEVNNLLVLHKCDNRKCVNPEHLFLGNQKDNMNDMRFKNRDKKASGEQAGPTKLTENIVLSIRSDYNTGNFTHKQLAIKYNTTEGNCSRITRKETWRNI